MLGRTAEAIDTLIDTIGGWAAWLVLVVVLLLFLQLPLRELVGVGYITANDVGQLVHAAVFMIGVPYCLRWNQHVRMDLLYRRMNPRRQALVDLIGCLFLLMPWTVITAVYSVPMVLRSLAVRERFPETFTPGYFLLRLLLLVFTALLALQAVAIAARAGDELLHGPRED